MKRVRFVRNKQSGFTIVELLIVIVVIAILAAVTIMAFTGLQKRARDTDRLADVQAINKALLQYHALYGTYPDETPTSASSTELSTDTPGTFLEELKNKGLMQEVPIDPTNDATYNYTYYFYTPGWGANGCDNARGGYYVLQVNRFESGASANDTSPGFSCTRNWQSSSNWVTGGYER